MEPCDWAAQGFPPLYRKRGNGPGPPGGQVPFALAIENLLSMVILYGRDGRSTPVPLPTPGQRTTHRRRQATRGRPTTARWVDGGGELYFHAPAPCLFCMENH